MQSKRVLILVVMAVILTAGATIASASIQRYAFCPFRASYCDFPPLAFVVDGAPKPKALPRSEKAPVSVEVRGKVSYQGNHPPALREVVVDLDKNAEINANGLPACGLRHLERRRMSVVRTACKGAIVGTGWAKIGLTAPDQAPIQAPLTLFNGGISGGTAKLFVHGELATSPPLSLVATVKIEKVRKGRYGIGTAWRIPIILEGRGSLVDFGFRISDRYASARCTDGKLQANIVKAIFRNEIGPRTATAMSGAVIRPCTPKG